MYASGIAGKGETIVIVDSYGSPTIKNDLTVFDRTFGLNAPPDRFKVVTPAGADPPGTRPPTPTMVGWAWPRPRWTCRRRTPSRPTRALWWSRAPVDETEGVTGFPQIEQAEEDVLNHPAEYGITGQIAVISQSFSATEETFTGLQQVEPLRAAYQLADKDGVTVLTASGDSGAADVGLDESTYFTTPVTSWPDSDPLVTGVGGTEVIDNDNHYSSTTWNDTYSTAVNEYIFGDAGPNPLVEAAAASRAVHPPGLPGWRPVAVTVTHRAASRTSR